MSLSSVRTVGVVGTGVIGSQWIALFLARGRQVLVSDPADGAKEQLAKDLANLWPRMEKLGLSKGASIKNHEFVGKSLGKQAAQVDFVQENGPEEQSLKESVVGEIDEGTRDDVIIASSSSGIASSQFIGKCKKNPARVMIAHPFAPPHLMPLVEIVPHPKSDEKCISKAIEFYRNLGKHPIRINHEIPGFVANRLQAAVSSEAYSLVHRGILSAEDLDAAVTTSIGPRYATTGPFMSNVLGGGATKDGFKDFMTKLGPAVKEWLQDMQANKVETNEEVINKLNESVQEMLKHEPPKQTEAERDDALIELIQTKEKEKYLV